MKGGRSSSRGGAKAARDAFAAPCTYDVLLKQFHMVERPAGRNNTLPVVVNNRSCT